MGPAWRLPTVAVHVRCGGVVDSRQRIVVLPQVLNGQTGCQQVPLDLFFKMVSSVSDMHFHAKRQSLQVDPSHGALF